MLSALSTLVSVIPIIGFAYETFYQLTFGYALLAH